MKHQETVIIIDFGGQYAQLIARRVRECGVYCEILPYNKPAEEILPITRKALSFPEACQCKYGKCPAAG